MERARLSRTALRKLSTEQPIFPIGNGADGPDWTLPDQLDDRTADYVLSVHGAFERLNDAARQVAAVLILKASGASGLRDHPALLHARQSVEEAHAAVRAAEPSPRAAHHHGHLLRSIEAFGDVFSRSDDARSSAGRDTRPALAALRSAADHLRWAAGALPGFEVVALGQGCGCCRPLDRGAFRGTATKPETRIDGGLFDLGA